MALHLTSKAAGDTRAYEWAPRLADGDSIDTYTLTPTTVTVSGAKNEGDRVTFKVAGGVAGTTYPIAASAVTVLGETLTETIYLPIRSDAKALSYTVRDICDFALRKVVGNGNSATADELDDATERLADMLAEWAASGADTGIPLPITANDTVFAPDGFISAIKHNLRIVCHEHYGQPVDASDVIAAKRGLQIIKARNLPDDRMGADYY